MAPQWWSDYAIELSSGADLTFVQNDRSAHVRSVVDERPELLVSLLSVSLICLAFPFSILYFLLGSGGWASHTLDPVW